MINVRILDKLARVFKIINQKIANSYYHLVQNNNTISRPDYLLPTAATNINILQISLAVTIQPSFFLGHFFFFSFFLRRSGSFPTFVCAALLSHSNLYQGWFLFGFYQVIVGSSLYPFKSEARWCWFCLMPCWVYLDCLGPRRPYSFWFLLSASH